MKLTYILPFLTAALFFTGCATTPAEAPDGASPDQRVEGQERPEGSRLLMDQYISGEIPGFRD